MKMLNSNNLWNVSLLLIMVTSPG